MAPYGVGSSTGITYDGRSSTVERHDQLSTETNASTKTTEF
jgi:hypothetical protein